MCTLKEHSPEAELMCAIYQGGAKTPPGPSALAVSPPDTETGSAWLDSETRIYPSPPQDKGLCKNTGSHDVLLAYTPAGYLTLRLSQSG